VAKQVTNNNTHTYRRSAWVMWTWQM